MAVLAQGSFGFDANNNPIIVDGVTTQAIQTLTGNNATVATAIFRVTGIIEVRALWAIVTTTLGANNTAAYWRLNDQTAQVNITLNTGTTLSAAAAGSFISKTGLATSALTLKSAAAGKVGETSANLPYFQTFTFQKKPAANTDIEFVYSTTDTPTTGVLQHFIRWLPLSADANIVVQST